MVSLEKDASLQVDPAGALRKSFVSTDAALVITEMNYMTSGCTCVAVYVRDTKLYVANVGDSRAVMAYKPLLNAGESSSSSASHHLLILVVPIVPFVVVVVVLVVM